MLTQDEIDKIVKDYHLSRLSAVLKDIDDINKKLVSKSPRDLSELPTYMLVELYEGQGHSLPEANCKNDYLRQLCIDALLNK